MTADVISRRKVIRVYLPVRIYMYLLVVDFRPPRVHIFIPKLKKMEESNVTIRKHCATDKIPLGEVSGRCCWQSVQTDRKKQRKTNMACVNSWARPAGSSVLFVGPSSSCALLPLWPLIRFFLVPSRKKSTSPQSFLLPLFLSDINTHSHTSPLSQGCTPSLSFSVHFLSAGQHCLLEEREHEEDTGSLPPLALSEVIRHDIIYKEKGKMFINLPFIQYPYSYTT